MLFIEPGSDGSAARPRLPLRGGTLHNGGRSVAGAGPPVAGTEPAGAVILGAGGVRQPARLCRPESRLRAPFPCPRFPDGSDFVALLLSPSGRRGTSSSQRALCPHLPPPPASIPAPPPPRHARGCLFTHPGAARGGPAPPSGSVTPPPSDVTGRGRGGGAPRAGWERCPEVRWSPRLCPPNRGLEAFFRTPYREGFVLPAELLQALSSRFVCADLKSLKSEYLCVLCLSS